MKKEKIKIKDECDRQNPKWRGEVDMKSHLLVKEFLATDKC